MGSHDVINGTERNARRTSTSRPLSRSLGNAEEPEYVRARGCGAPTQGGGPGCVFTGFQTLL